jgi:hypothetical protein
MIESITLILLAITALFILLIAVQSFFQFRFCALCLSSFLTWFSLLVLYWFGFFHNLVFIAVLVGGSAVGIFHLAEKKLPEKFYIFKLPFFLSLLFIAYLLVGASSGLLRALIFLFLLWVFFSAVYFYRNNPNFKNFARRLIACCKDW